MPIGLHIICGCFSPGRAEFSRDRPYRLQSQKYLLPGPLQKKLTDCCLGKLSPVCPWILQEVEAKEGGRVSQVEKGRNTDSDNISGGSLALG